MNRAQDCGEADEGGWWSVLELATRKLEDDGSTWCRRQGLRMGRAGRRNRNVSTHEKKEIGQWEVDGEVSEEANWEGR